MVDRTWLISREIGDDEAFMDFFEQGISAVLREYRRDPMTFHSLILREQQVFASEHPDSPFRLEIRRKIVNEEAE